MSHDALQLKIDEALRPRLRVGTFVLRAAAGLAGWGLASLAIYHVAGVPGATVALLSPTAALIGYAAYQGARD